VLFIILRFNINNNRFNFYPQRSNGNGGAIYNVGTLKLKATAGNSTSFTTATDTVYLTTGSTTYLNAGAAGAINFNGAVSTPAIGNVIEVNSTTGDASLTAGTINFNSTLTNATVNMHSGVLQFGATAVAPASTYTSNVNIALSGGTLSLQNNQAGDILNLNKLYNNQQSYG